MASGAGGVDVTDGKLFMNITAKDDNKIDVLTVNEMGGYVIAGAGGTAATQVNANVLGLSVAINAIDGMSVDGPTAIGTMTYYLVSSYVTLPPGGGIPSGPGVTPVAFPIGGAGDGTWAGTASFNLSDLLVGTQWEGHNVTGASLVFDNLLTAQSETGTVAMIDKKRVWVTGNCEFVPEPGTIVLLGIGGIGLAGFCCLRRRRSSLATAV